MLIVSQNKGKFQTVKIAYVCESGEWKVVKKFECKREYWVWSNK